MAILMFPFWVLERLFRWLTNRQKKKVASPCCLRRQQESRQQSGAPKRNAARQKPKGGAEPNAKQGTLYKGFVVSFGTATCRDSGGRTYRTYVLRLKDSDGTFQELRGIDLQLLVDAGKVIKGRFIKILAYRQYLTQPGGRRVWKNTFSIV
ncbi:MAG: hypothetical protein J5492_01400 [Oxalobacter sp.]|nr:hypothetical protein [Oxalobacter sp.]